MPTLNEVAVEKAREEGLAKGRAETRALLGD